MGAANSKKVNDEQIRKEVKEYPIVIYTKSQCNVIMLESMRDNYPSRSSIQVVTAKWLSIYWLQRKSSIEKTHVGQYVLKL